MRMLTDKLCDFVNHSPDAKRYISDLSQNGYAITSQLSNNIVHDILLALSRSHTILIDWASITGCGVPSGVEKSKANDDIMIAMFHILDGLYCSLVKNGEPEILTNFLWFNIIDGSGLFRKVSQLESQAQPLTRKPSTSTTSSQNKNTPRTTYGADNTAYISRVLTGEMMLNNDHGLDSHTGALTLVVNRD
ncbi:MAG: hypothetical protein IKE05_03295 [Clostridia bacterium]|nr:hypothetical protein [Clostridia bacterium]